MKPYSKSYLAQLLIFLSIGLLSSCLNNDDENTNEQEFVKVGDVVPEFHLIGENGETISSTSMLGQVYLLSFFDTGCRDCQKEFPILQQIYDKYQDALPVINVPRSQTADEVKEYWSKTGLSMPVYTPTDKSLYYKFATRGIPRIYIIDKTGKVLNVFTDSPIADYDTLDGILNPLVGNIKDGIKVSFRIVATKNLSDELEDGIEVESNISHLDIFFFNPETEKLVTKVVIDSLGNKIKTNKYDSYWVETKKIPTGNYNIFAVANYKNIPQNIEEQKDLINLIDAETYKKGLGSSIPEEGPIMTSRADTLLNLDLTSKKVKEVTIVIEMERVIAKLRISSKSDGNYVLEHGGTKYADIRIASYKLTNLMTQYYLFQHVDNVPALIGEPNFKFPENFVEYTAKENQYVVDPLFYKKTLNDADIQSFQGYYQYWYGNKESSSSEWAPFAQTNNIYILENTAYKDCQINAYSTGVEFYASVKPVFVYEYKTDKHDVEPDYGESWGDSIYLYDYNFYKTISDINLKHGLSIPENIYTDKDLNSYGLKKCKNRAGSFYTYYTYWIEHLRYAADSDRMGPMRYGIIRNNLYNIVITGISDIGSSEITPNVKRENYLDVKVN